MFLLNRFLLFLSIGALLLGSSSAQDVKYNEKTKKEFDYRFGKSPWLPSQAVDDSGDFIPVSQFPSASFCKKCHEEAHRQWRESAHSNSFRPPFYKRSVDLLITTKGIEFSRHCEGCHNPIALFSGVLTKRSKASRSFDDDGITCMVCHSIKKVQNTSGTGSYVMGTPAVMVKEDGTPLTEQVSFDKILAQPKLHSQAVMRDFYRTPEFCSVCHKAAVPRQLNDYKWLRAFNVFDEWQNSSWAKRSPLSFYKKEVVSTCQTCHMPAVDAKLDYGAKNGKLKSHRWLGANTAIPAFYGFDEQLKQTIAFLQNETLGIDIFALAKGTSDEIVAPLDKQTFNLAPQDSVTLSLVIQNKGIGHSLVPEQRDFYESWVEFTVTDAAGKTITHSGFLKPDHFLDERAHSYTNRLISKQGKLLDKHEVWLTRTRAYDNTIQSGRSDLVRYEFTIPADAKSPLTVSAKVNYRRFRQGWLDYALQKGGAEYPVVRMASKAISLNVGENRGNSDAPDQKEMLRWNNYGIALLGQQQYSRAAAVFAKVVEIRPDYVDGYINIALANYSYQQYPAAMDMLDRALQMNPGNARALYYKAAILKTQGKLDDSVELLKQVRAQYPLFADAARELGFTYYQQKKYSLARSAYETLQTIDPDDLAAHYNLMLIYRRLGLKDKAAEQAAHFADRKDDPGALAYALDFLRSNPQISNESVPWHVHFQSHSASQKSNGNTD